jgi:Protein of unknown function (DUF3617)
MRRVCLVMAMLVVPAAMVAQAPQAPPVKMGLWQSTMTSTMSGMQIPPDVAAKLQAMGRPVPGAQPRTTVTQSCLTQEKWQKSFTDMQQDKNCQISNLHQSSSGMSGDIACKSEDGSRSSTGHLDVTFVSEEKSTGKVHLEVMSSRQPQPITMNMTFESVYQGSDCKGISPDSPKVVK